MMLTGPDDARALFDVADTTKGSSHRAIKELHAPGIKALMSNGGDPYTTGAVT